MLSLVFEIGIFAELSLVFYGPRAQMVTLCQMATCRLWWLCWPFACGEHNFRVLCAFLFHYQTPIYIRKHDL